MDRTGIDEYTSNGHDSVTDTRTGGVCPVVESPAVNNDETTVRDAVESTTTAASTSTTTTRRAHRFIVAAAVLVRGHITNYDDDFLFRLDHDRDDNDASSLVVVKVQVDWVTNKDW